MNERCLLKHCSSVNNVVRYANNHKRNDFIHFAQIESASANYGIIFLTKGHKLRHTIAQSSFLSETRTLRSFWRSPVARQAALPACGDFPRFFGGSSEEATLSQAVGRKWLSSRPKVDIVRTIDVDRTNERK